MGSVLSHFLVTHHRHTFLRISIVDLTLQPTAKMPLRIAISHRADDGELLVFSQVGLR
jgi:hypothetical protein